MVCYTNLIRAALVFVLPIASVALPSPALENGLHSRLVTPGEEIIQVLSTSTLPRVQRFEVTASELNSGSTLLDLYKTLEGVRTLSADSNKISQLFGEFWEVPLTSGEAQGIIEITNKITDTMLVVLSKVDAVLPAVFDGVSIVELRPLVIMARSALSTLSALASSLYLSLEGAEYPNQEQLQLAEAISNHYTNGLSASINRWVSTSKVGKPNGVDITPALEPWQDLVLWTLKDTLERAEAFKAQINALKPDSVWADFWDPLYNDPIRLQSLPYADQYDLVNSASEPFALSTLEGIMTTMYEAYTILRDEKYPFLLTWSDKSRRTSIMRMWGTAADLDATSFDWNFVERLLKIVQSSSAVGPQIEAMMGDFAKEMKEMSQFAWDRAYI